MSHYPFHSDEGEPHGSFEIFQEDKDPRQYDPMLRDNWFWWPCFPGCLPDGDKIGPFKTWKECFNDADPGKSFGLEREALEACNLRGHSMTKFKEVKDYVSRSECTVCRKEVTCTVHPAPNDIDIGGEAVALGCE